MCGLAPGGGGGGGGGPCTLWGGGGRSLHSVGLSVRISVLKTAEKGVFEGKIRMSLILEKRGLF